MFYNWIQSSIHEVMVFFPEMFNAFPFVLVTVIDSSTDIKFMMEHHCKDLGNIRYKLCDKGVILAGRDLMAFDDAINAFTGFGEIWCFEEKPKMCPANLSLVCPLDIREEFSKTFEQWMIDSKCILGMGDGTLMGLNYITTSEEIRDEIEKLDGGE